MTREELRVYWRKRYYLNRIEILRKNKEKYHKDIEASRLKQRKHYKDNIDVRRKQAADYKDRNRIKINRQKRERCAILRNEVIAAYGGKCQCKYCPETNQAFLTIDHINGDGREHRKKVSKQVYKDLKQKGFPKKDYRILCMNCNFMSRFNGICPHQQKELEL